MTGHMRHLISPIEDLISEMQNGHAVVIVDTEDREDEGDIVVAAQYATPDQVNFMARHARGLICLALTAERAAAMKLEPMVDDVRDGLRTSFTRSIEAREGVTTGISAHDRARTISVAINAESQSDDLVSPGHVFPMVGREGGVLVRTGHTEAAIDLARLAGLTPASVICQIINDDGTMARFADLCAFAEEHGLKVGTIADLIAYRYRTDHFVEAALEIPFESVHGDFRLRIYRNTIDCAEHAVLIRGTISPAAPTMVRMHQVDFGVDLLGHVEARSNYIANALQMLGDHDGPGVAVFLRDADPASLTRRYSSHKAMRETALRDYGVGAQILRDLGVTDMILLTSSAAKLAALSGYGLKIVERRAIVGSM